MKKILVVDDEEKLAATVTRAAGECDAGTDCKL